MASGPAACEILDDRCGRGELTTEEYRSASTTRIETMDGCGAEAR